AAYIHRRHFGSRRIRAETDGCAAARLAEVVLNYVLVEGIGAEFIFGGQQTQLRARHEPQQIALAAAMRAIAFDDVLRLTFDFKRNTAAVAASRVHGSILLQHTKAADYSIKASDSSAAGRSNM